MKNLPLRFSFATEQIHFFLITQTATKKLMKPPENQGTFQQENPLSDLYTCYAPSLKLVILKLIPSTETVDDLLHDSFIKINNSLHTYQPDRSQLLTWMKAIAKNTTVDYLRLRTTRNTTLNKSIDHCEEELGRQYFSSVNIDLIGVRELLKSLTPQQALIIELIYFKGFTHEEVAEVLGIPLGTLKTRLRKSIRELRQLFS